jgi:hypothetical protein
MGINHGRGDLLVSTDKTPRHKPDRILPGLPTTVIIITAVIGALFWIVFWIALVIKKYSVEMSGVKGGT